MDNSREIVGYKRYRDPKSGKFDNIYVTFLNIKKSKNEYSYVFGVIYEVTPEIINVVDNRERNYWRTHLSRESFLISNDDQLSFSGGFVWTYIAQPSGMGRFLNGQRSGQAFIQEEYLERFENALQIHGEEYRSYIEARVPRLEGDLAGKTRSLEQVDF